MIQSGINNKIRFKNTEIDLLEFAFGILRDDFSNMIEVFRLEGCKQPMIRKELISEYADYHFRALHYQWNDLSNRSSRAPNLTDLNIETIVDVAANLRLMKCHHEQGDFSEYNTYDFIQTHLFIPNGKRVSDMIKSRNSVVGVLYHACLNVAMISAEPIHTVHFSPKQEGEQKMWLTMYLPFYYENPNYPDHIFMLQKEI